MHLLNGYLEIVLVCQNFKNAIALASLVISLGYEYELDDGLMPKHLQKIRTKLFPGSAMLKEIQRKYQKENKDGIFIKKAKGVSEDDEMLKLA